MFHYSCTHTMLFVNITINNKFNEYMLNIQNKREERIVTYFQGALQTGRKWNKDSGVELIHEAYMGVLFNPSGCP